ncbi:lipid A-modifier LpxR family protein [Loktanella sp. R86503]|uniref:lipid A-modifier LpxR family protein n=1 Tax=Loktanella sp. R86503 TaxID=3093847 RepID=UPI0036DC4CBA
MRHLALILFCALFTGITASQTDAQSNLFAQKSIGNGRLFNNDLFGDGHDRWRTGSYVFSHLRAADPDDGGLRGIGEVMEYRFRTEIIAPTRRTRDRPYVGMVSLGAHTHYALGPADISLGGDVLAIGPQTGLDDFQKAYHRAFSLPRPTTRNALPDQLAFQGSGEARYTYNVTPGATLRPFVEAKAGAEDMVRAGADLLVGAIGQNDVLLRDVVTGQLYRGTQGGETGVSFVLGGDVAAVKDSLFLPSSDGYVVSPTRTRARAGVNWQPVPGMSFFYGATYLSREFEAQDEGQVVGSLKLNFNF